MTNAEKYNQLELFGFGPNVMMKTKICPNCGHAVSGENDRCTECGGKLTGGTLFDIYKKLHPICTSCGAILSHDSFYCSNCGKRTVTDTVSTLT